MQLFCLKRLDVVAQVVYSLCHLSFIQVIAFPEVHAPSRHLGRPVRFNHDPISQDIRDILGRKYSPVTFGKLSQVWRKIIEGVRSRTISLQIISMAGGAKLLVEALTRGGIPC